ncbi:MULTISPECIES: urease accessory protein UreF [unclassified Devosia]|uniref:urease accessory protein UreF n=1 Tax=unclassified Devosia TaxID=196773 RepID=UPI000AF23C61|nr:MULTISPECIES: urease accessory UreF family protein [unclassified Devosia]MBN9303862.1 urease accessory protein UreF [Devosia sp.]
MADGVVLQRLLTWLSPAFPVGGFAWSQGLETAIADGRIATGAALAAWLDGLLTHGGLRTDAIVLAHAHRGNGDPAALRELAELLLALTAAAERTEETTLTGGNFALAARAWPSDVFARLPDPCPYPVAVGAIAGAQRIGLGETLLAYLTAAVQAQVSVAVRLVPLGQTAGLQVQAALEPAIATLAGAAASASLDAIGGIAYAADIAQMRHETLEPRIFRS